MRLRQDLDRLVRNAFRTHTPDTSDSDAMWNAMAGRMDANQRRLAYLGVYMAICFLVTVAFFVQHWSHYSDMSQNQFEASDSRPNSVSGAQPFIFSQPLDYTQLMPESDKGREGFGGNTSAHSLESVKEKSLAGNRGSASVSNSRSVVFASKGNASSNFWRNGALSSSKEVNSGVISPSKSKLELYAATDYYPDLENISSGIAHLNKKPKASSDNSNSTAYDFQFLNSIITFWNHPGYTGSEGNLSIHARGNFSTARNGHFPQTNYIAAAEFGAPHLHSNFGVSFTQSLSRSEIVNKASLTYAYNLKVAGGDLRVGLAAGIYSKTMFGKTDVLRMPLLNNAMVSLRGTQVQSHEYTLGMDGGLVYKRGSWIGGVSMLNINKPEFNYENRMERSTSGFLAKNIDIGNNFILQPLAVFHQEVSAINYDAHISLIYKRIFMLNANLQQIRPDLINPVLGFQAGVDVKGHLKAFATFSKPVFHSESFSERTELGLGLKYQLNP